VIRSLGLPLGREEHEAVIDLDILEMDRHEGSRESGPRLLLALNGEVSGAENIDESGIRSLPAARGGTQASSGCTASSADRLDRRRDAA
jgi:hypothetical protein